MCIYVIADKFVYNLLFKTTRLLHNTANSLFSTLYDITLENFT